jgi:hypothetical protein
VVGMRNTVSVKANKIKEILTKKGNKIYTSWNGADYNRSLDTFEEHPYPDYLITFADSIEIEDETVKIKNLEELKQQAILPKYLIAIAEPSRIKVTHFKPIKENDMTLHKKIKEKLTLAIMPFSKVG